MTKMRPYAIACVVAVALPIALAAAPDSQVLRSHLGKELSDVVYPDQALPLRFSHSKHLVLEGVDCQTCHTAAAGSRSSLDNLIPAEAACRACHPIDRDKPNKVVAGAPTARCVDCHPGYQPGDRVVDRIDIPRPLIKFDHASHIARGTSCRDCHGDLLARGIDLATRQQLPPMSLCTECHDGGEASGECTVCHLAEPGGRIKTDFIHGQLAPSGQLFGMAHDLNFRQDHRAAAMSDRQTCSTCHKQEECVDCHMGSVKPMDFHAGDYVALHSIEARRGSPDCSACHREQTFCVGCHSRSGVAADGAGSEFVPPSIAPSGRRFHPPGWVEFEGTAPVTGDDSRGRDHHSFQAQRNIRQCASCHRESFCTTCHTAQPGSFRINPHPNGWRGSRRCESLRRRNGRMCLRCHTEDLAVPSCI